MSLEQKANQLQVSATFCQRNCFSVCHLLLCRPSAIPDTIVLVSAPTVTCLCGAMFRSACCPPQLLWPQLLATQEAVQVIVDAGVLPVTMTTMDCGRAFMLQGWRSNTLSRGRSRTGNALGIGAFVDELPIFSPNKRVFQV